MSSTIVFNGTSYSIPTDGDSSWGTDLSNYFIAIASGSLQKSGGSFALTSEIDFGANFGLKSSYLKSRASNPAGAGVLRLGNTESIKWRNAANNADLDLTVNASNLLQFNGSSILLPGIGSIVNADVNASAAIAYSKLNLSSSIVNADISASAAIAYSKLNLSGAILNADVSGSAAIAYSKLNLSSSIVNADVSGSAAIAYSKLNLATSIVNADISASAAIAYSKLNIANSDLTIAKTNGLQTALDSKVDKSTLTTKGDLYVATASATIARQGIGSDGQILVSDSSQVNGLKWSTISGGVNYILNPGAEASTTGWATYADAAATSPVDGTGGSPNSTWTRSTSSPLHGSGMFILTHNSGASRQGEGASYDFTIDAGDKAKVLQVEFDYQLVSGTFTAGSDTTTSDLTVWIYDVTNSTLIQPSTYKLFSNSSTLPTKFISNFQSAANSTSYRLIVHCGSTSTSAFVMSFDDFKVAPCNYVYGTPITNSQAYTPVIQNNTGGMTNYTATGRWAQVGEKMVVTGGITFSGTSAAFTNIYVNLPTGKTVDTSKLIASSGTQILGTVRALRSGVTFYAIGQVAYDSTSRVILTLTQLATHSGTQPILQADITNTAPHTWTTGDAIVWEFDIPISGWSSSVQQSDSYDGRIIAASYSGVTTGSVGAAYNTTTYPTKVFDTTNSYSGGTYTVPSSGIYCISAYNEITGTEALNSETTIAVFVNGSLSGYVNSTRSPGTVGSTTVGGSRTFQFNAGDLVTVRLYTDIGSPSYGSATILPHFSIFKLQSPATISATELVALTVSGSTTTAAGAVTNISWLNKELDTHNAFSSNEFTVPVSGVYEVKLAMRHNGAGHSVNQISLAYIQTDTGSGYVTRRQGFKFVENATVASFNHNTFYQASLKAGDKIRARHETTLTGPTISVSAEDVHMSITKIK